MAEGAPPSPLPPRALPSSARPPLPPPPGALATLRGDEVAPQQETYVIQVPKDQIYRVPPPENATLAEQYRNTENNKRRRISPCLIGLGGFVAIGLVVTGIIFAVAAALPFILKPETPTFAVEGLLVKNPGKGKSPEYSFTVQAKNPSKHTGYTYQGANEAVLIHKNLIIADGSTPGFDQSKQSATTFALVFHGKRAPPKEVDKALKDAKDVIPLGLEFEFKLKYKVGGTELFWQKSVNVKCEVKVRGLVQEAKMISQKCDAYLD